MDVDFAITAAGYGVVHAHGALAAGVACIAPVIGVLTPAACVCSLECMRPNHADEQHELHDIKQGICHMMQCVFGASMLPTPCCRWLHHVSCIAAVLQTAAPGGHAVRLVSAAAGDRALQAAIQHHTISNSADVLLLLWQALLDNKLFGASQEPYWPLISYMYSNFTQLAMDHLRSLPVKLQCTEQLQELVAVGQQLKLVTGSADVLDVTQKDVWLLWGAAGAKQQQGIVQRHNDRSRSSKGTASLHGRQAAPASSMYRVAVQACVLPWAGIADATLPGNPSLLRVLVRGQHPLEIYELAAGATLASYSFKGCVVQAAMCITQACSLQLEMCNLHLL
jgi:hypothetical protein